MKQIILFLAAIYCMPLRGYVLYNYTNHPIVVNIYRIEEKKGKIIDSKIATHAIAGNKGEFRSDPKSIKKFKENQRFYLEVQENNHPLFDQWAVGIDLDPRGYIVFYHDEKENKLATQVFLYDVNKAKSPDAQQRANPYRLVEDLPRCGTGFNDLHHRLCPSKLKEGGAWVDVMNDTQYPIKAYLRQNGCVGLYGDNKITLGCAQATIPPGRIRRLKSYNTLIKEFQVVIDTPDRNLAGDVMHYIFHCKVKKNEVLPVIFSLAHIKMSSFPTIPKGNMWMMLPHYSFEVRDKTGAVQCTKDDGSSCSCLEKDFVLYKAVAGK